MNEEAKSEQLQIRVNPRQKTAIRRAAKRAGLDMSSWVLQRALPESHVEFVRLVDQLGRQVRQPSYALAAINDWLDALGAHELRVAVADPPRMNLGDYLDNYLAAMIEVAAYRKGVTPPAWTAGVRPLVQPVFGAQLMSVRLYLLVNSPPPFRRRNIFIDATIGDRV